jgi:hypothetical protein
MMPALGSPLSLDNFGQATLKISVRIKEVHAKYITAKERGTGPAVQIGRPVKKREIKQGGKDHG